MKKTIYRPEYRRILRKLKQARIAAGMSQQDVADRLKVEQTFVSKSELGERRVDILELIEFSRVYKKPLSYFIE